MGSPSMPKTSSRWPPADGPMRQSCLAGRQLEVIPLVAMGCPPSLAAFSVWMDCSDANTAVS
jgi:hypothetical protein